MDPVTEELAPVFNDGYDDDGVYVAYGDFTDYVDNDEYKENLYNAEIEIINDY